MKIYKFPYAKGHTRNDTDKCIFDAVTSYMEEKGITPTGSIYVRRTALGKPFVEGCAGLYISITHAGNILLTAVSENEIGIDCEESTRKIRDIKAFSNRFCTLAEREKLNEFSQSEKERAFLEIWTKKEALVKLSGEGLSAITKTDSLNLSANIKLEIIGDYPGYIVAIAEKNRTTHQGASLK